MPQEIATLLAALDVEPRAEERADVFACVGPPQILRGQPTLVRAAPVQPIGGIARAARHVPGFRAEHHVLAALSEPFFVQVPPGTRAVGQAALRPPVKMRQVADFVGKQAGQHVGVGPAFLGNVFQPQEHCRGLPVGRGPARTTADPYVDHKRHFALEPQPLAGYRLGWRANVQQVQVGQFHRLQPLAEGREHPLARDLAPIVAVIGSALNLLFQEFWPLRHVRRHPTLDLLVYRPVLCRHPEFPKRRIRVYDGHHAPPKRYQHFALVLFAKVIIRTTTPPPVNQPTCNCSSADVVVYCKQVSTIRTSVLGV